MEVRIVLITQGLSRVVSPLINSEFNIVGIIESATRNYGQNSKPHRRNFKNLLGFTKQKQTLENLSAQLSIPYFFFRNNNKDLISWLNSVKPDLIVVYSMSQLLHAKILEISPLGVINIHPSLLPDYRGPNPWFWMYYNGDKQGGVTLHYLDSGEDTGDIVYQKKYDIPLGMKSPHMQDVAIGKIGVEILLKALSILSCGEKLPRIEQPVTSGTERARNISVDEHDSLIDWKNWPIERIWHFMRGTELWLNSIHQPSGVFKGLRWKVLEFEKCDSANTKISGSVERDSTGYYVVCRDGAIRLDVKFRLRVFISRVILRRK
jgi:methionyl-tRNA formyltransferase